MKLQKQNGLLQTAVEEAREQIARDAAAAAGVEKRLQQEKESLQVGTITMCVRCEFLFSFALYVDSLPLQRSASEGDGAPESAGRSGATPEAQRRLDVEREQLPPRQKLQR